MDSYKLASIYSLACLRIESASTELYESLFDDAGEPIKSVDLANENIRLFQRQVSAEADFIRQAIKEYLDERG